MVTWDIQRDGRAWGDEAMSRCQMTPEKTEMVAERLRRTALSVSTPVTSTSRRWWVRHDSDSILMIHLLERAWL